MSEYSSCIIDAVSRPASEGQFDMRSSGIRVVLDVTSTVECDVLEVLDILVNNDTSEERISVDYSAKSGVILGISGLGSMKSASALKVERKLLNSSGLRSAAQLLYCEPVLME